MLQKKRNYFWICIILLFTGIFSRKIAIIPLYVGDILYACLIYFGFRYCFHRISKHFVLLLSLVFCFSIEYSQLLQWSWLINIRKYTLGHYILGEGFLSSDLLCYTLGTLLSYFSDFYFLKFETHSRS